MPASELNPRGAQTAARVVCDDVKNFSLANFEAWHIDPDRRPTGRRTTRINLHEPGPEVLKGLLMTCPSGAIKLAPAATFEEPWWKEAELEWISRDRQCRQLVAWFGALAQHSGKRRATKVRGGSNERSNTIAASFIGQPNLESAVAPKLGRYVFEPDPAVLAAKIEGALAAKLDLQAVAIEIAYFTADRATDHPLMSAFEVLDVMPYHAKTIRKWLAARGIKQIEIKKRGVPLDPEAVRRDVLPREQNHGQEVANGVTILLTRIDGRICAIMGRRVI